MIDDSSEIFSKVLAECGIDVPLQAAVQFDAGGIIPTPATVAQRPGGTYKRAMQYKTILFDLDGTLTDSEPGIVNSVRYALRSFGMEAEPATLRSFIGPPL